MRPLQGFVIGTPQGVKEPNVESGRLPLPTSICASGSVIVPAHTAPVKHTNIPQVPTKCLLHIRQLLPSIPRCYYSHGYAAGEPSQLKVHYRKRIQGYPYQDQRFIWELSCRL